MFRFCSIQREQNDICNKQACSAGFK